MPKLVTVPTPKPVDPVREARARLDAQRAVPPSYIQLTRQHVMLLEGDLARLDTELETRTRDRTMLATKLQHLTAFLALADPQEV